MVLLEKRVVWDVPTRVFHWLFALSVLLSMLIVYGKSYLALHIVFGSLAFVLLLGRIVWGVFGTKYVKFKTFLKSKDDFKSEFSFFFNKEHKHIVGHPPVAGYIMLVMIFSGLLICASGLCLYLFELDESTKEMIFYIHEVLANTLLVIAFVHVQGVFLHMFLNSDGIIMGMLDGKRPAYEHEQIGKLSRPQKLIATIWFGLSVLVVVFVSMFWRG